MDENNEILDEKIKELQTVIEKSQGNLIEKFEEYIESNKYEREIETLKQLCQKIMDLYEINEKEIAKGLETCPEGGERCFRCYALRLEKTAQLAKEGGYDYFTTTLTISPLKNAAKLNELSEYLLDKETITGEEFMEILNG